MALKRSFSALLFGIAKAPPFEREARGCVGLATPRTLTFSLAREF